MDRGIVLPTQLRHVLDASTDRFPCLACGSEEARHDARLPFEERMALYRRLFACPECCGMGEVSFSDAVASVADVAYFQALLRRVTRALSARRREPLETACEAANVVLCIRDAVRSRPTSGLSGFEEWPEWPRFVRAEDRGSKRLGRFHGAARAAATRRTKAQREEVALRVEESAAVSRSASEIQDELRAKYGDGY